MINISGNYLLESPRQRVWPLLFEPDWLMGMIPGCEELVQVAPNEYRGQIRVGLAAVSGVYDTCVLIKEFEQPYACCFEGEVIGPTGTIKGEAIFHLDDTGQSCKLNYTANALITGALAKLNPRFIDGAVQTLLQIGFRKMNQRLRSMTAEIIELNHFDNYT